MTGWTDKIEQFLRKHEPEIEDTFTAAAEVATDPGAELFAGLVHLPPSVLSAVADGLRAADAELAKYVAAPPAAAAPEPPATDQAAAPSPTPAVLPAATNAQP